MTRSKIDIAERKITVHVRVHEATLKKLVKHMSTDIHEPKHSTVLRHAFNQLALQEGVITKITRFMKSAFRFEWVKIG